MRDDIAKKMLEPPRYGGGGKSQFRSDRRAAKNHKNFDSLPKKESMKRPNIRGWNGKYFNATTAPLEGFLKKNVGRPWDKVYSEICSALRPTNATLKHVLAYLVPNMVELTPHFNAGSNIPYDPDGCNWKGRGERFEVSGFYVDRHGLLKNNDNEKARKRQKSNHYSRHQEVRKRINDLEEYRRITGVWYHVWYKHVRGGETGYDVILRKTVMIGRWGCYELERSNGKATHAGKVGLDAHRVCVDKRQISRKEIRREGLNKL